MQGLVVVLFIVTIALQVSTSAEKPNIVVILADDLGWNDVSFHGSDQIPTPNIDALAYNGIILNSHYVPALCTPSRAALLTGKYPTTLGMQHLVILAQEPWGLPIEETLLPEHLRRHGYSTHAIGKWHLGFHKKAYTPVHRGFDSFFGYYNGYQDYYDHTMEASDQDVPQKGYDMRRNLDLDFDSLGKYSTDAFTDEAVKIIRQHDDKQGPLFLYLAHLAPHSGNNDKPYQAPDDEVIQFAHIRDPERRVYSAMVSRLDKSVGRVVTALRETGKLDNSIILFLSDNGAVTFGVHSNHGSNYPLRGLKESPWEGGVRGVAALWSPLLNTTRRVSNQLMYMADWMPTVYSAAGLDVSELGEIDGKDMWAALSHDLQSPRTEVFNNYDEVEDYSSLRIGQWKYVSGTAQEGEVDDWYGESGEEDSPPPYNIHQVLFSEVNAAISGWLTEKQLKAYSQPGVQVQDLLTSKEVFNLRSSSIITCSKRRKGPLVNIHPDWATPSNASLNSSYATHSNSELLKEVQERIQEIQTREQKMDNSQILQLGDINCDPRKTVCLFHLDEDPCEELNVARLFPEVVARMESRLAVLKRFVRKPLNQPGDPLANPSLYNGTWTHWCDSENTPFTSSHFFSFNSIISHILDQKLSTILLDNIIIKILTIPLVSVFALLFQAILNVFQALFSLFSLIFVLVLFMFFVNFLKVTSSSTEQTKAL